MAKKPRKSKTSDRRLYAGLALLVACLAALVWWSLPGNHAPDAPRRDTSSSETEDREDADVRTGAIARPPRATAELAVITASPESVVRAAATAGEIGKRLDVKHCGGACDAVRKFMSDEDAFEIEIRPTDDLLLPPNDTLDTVAPGLTPTERAGLHGGAVPTAILVRTQGPANREQLPARAVFAAAELLVEQLGGFVYDEVSRRVETRREFENHPITVKLGEPAFARQHIVIQLYRQEDGTARLLTLGMARFGTADLSISGASMDAGPLLAEVINAAAQQLAHGKKDAPITITLDDIARVVGKKPSELNANASKARPVVLDVREPDRIEGDPDNLMIELVPSTDAGSSRDGWDEVITRLFGVTPSMAIPVDDKELAEIATKARRDLPGAIKRFEAGEGTLFLKGPFAIPQEARTDGGSASEMLWLEAAACDAKQCNGVLSNEPTYATNIALGKTASVKRAEAVDWMLQQRDGGTVGGESIKALERRAR